MNSEGVTEISLKHQHGMVIVLVVGVFGGLGLIIILLLCFKHCIKKPPQTG